jgi:hypothetical protein
VGLPLAGLPPGRPIDRVERRDHRGVLVSTRGSSKKSTGIAFGELEAADDRAGSEPDLKVIEQLLGELVGIELADEGAHDRDGLIVRRPNRAPQRGPRHTKQPAGSPRPEGRKDPDAQDRALSRRDLAAPCSASVARH